ncbi:hydroxypyruvate isomerase family protein [Pseudomonadota bacterium]
MPKFAANLTWLLQEYPWLDRFQAAKDLDFEAVECQFPYEHTAAELTDACTAADLKFIMFNAPPGDMEAGEYGLAGLPGREAEFQDSIGLALDYATILQSSYIHVLAGIVPEGESHEDCREVYIKNLSWALGQVDKAGVGILIEPINTFERPGYLTTLTSEAAEVCGLIDHPGLGIQFDFHNAQLMEGYITRTLETYIGLIQHMQIAGIPGRTPPDQGELNYPYYFDVVDRLGYQGWIGCEYRPNDVGDGATRASLGWASKFGIG